MVIHEILLISYDNFYGCYKPRFFIILESLPAPGCMAVHRRMLKLKNGMLYLGGYVAKRARTHTHTLTFTTKYTVSGGETERFLYS